MIINWIVKVLQSLNANQRPGEMAFAISLAFLIALLPPVTPLGLVILILTFFFRINQAVEMVFIGIFGLFVFTLDPLLHEVGYFLLNNNVTSGIFTALWNTPGIALFKPNNTLVVGAFTVGLLAIVPLFFLTRWLVTLYREKARQAVAGSAFVKFFLNLPLIKTLWETYQKVNKITKAL